MKLAYLINQYPKVSHTFVRREIEALERAGASVRRFALRGWNEQLPDPADAAEQERTTYLLRNGLLALVLALLAAAVRRPIRMVRALELAAAMARRGGRPLHHLVYLAEACALLRLLGGQGIDQLHAHFGTNGAEVAMLCRVLGGPPYSFTVHGPEEFDRAAALGLDAKAQRANAVIAISSFGRSQIWRWCRAADWPKVHVVPCGLDASWFAAPLLPVPSTPRLVSVGRLSEQKGHLVLLEAAALVAARGTPLELVLAGDGELRPAVEAAIARLGIAAHVRITGWLDGAAIQRELTAARGLVLASFAEGLPVVVMESMALGRPVLATWIAGTPELVRDGIDGWLFAPGSAAAAAAAMQACLDAPTGRLAAMGRAGRERVMERHDVDRSAALLLSIWRAAAGAQDPQPPD